MANATETQVDQQNQPEIQFDILKIFSKNISLETSNSPAIFGEEWKPEISVQLANLSNALNDEGLTEVCLRITVTAKIGDKSAFLCEVEQAGVFNIKGFSEDQLGHMEGAFCPNILFPYARETIDGLLTKAGFPAIQLAPINFDALYAQRQQDSAQPAQGNA